MKSTENKLQVFMRSGIGKALMVNLSKLFVI